MVKKIGSALRASCQRSAARSSGSSHKMVETGGQSDMRDCSWKRVENVLVFDFIFAGLG